MCHNFFFVVFFFFSDPKNIFWIWLIQTNAGLYLPFMIDLVPIVIPIGVKSIGKG